MGNDQKKSKSNAPVVKPPSAAEIKTYVMIIQNKIKLYRNKRVDSIRAKRKEIIKQIQNLKQQLTEIEYIININEIYSNDDLPLINHKM